MLNGVQELSGAGDRTAWCWCFPAIRRWPTRGCRQLWASRPIAAYKTRRLNREVACHYSFLHENLFDMNHQFLHRKNMGSIKARCLGRRGGETWCEVDYTFSRTEGRQSVGEAAILSAMRARRRHASSAT